MHWRTVCLLVALSLTYAAPALLANNGHKVRDEWEPIDRIVVATKPDKQLSPIVEQIVGEAVKNGVRVVVIDDDPVSQAAIRTRLKNLGLITAQTDSYVQFTNTPHKTSWARDESVIVKFDSTSGKASVTATHFTFGGDESHSAQIIKDVSALLKSTAADIPEVVFPPGFEPARVPLTIDGGDWMTTNGGQTLITTTDLYERHGGTDADIRNSVDKTLKDAFGITKVIDLKPLDKTAPGYELANAHVDLQVRTLPGNKVIVARVPATDPQSAILEANAAKLAAAGFTVIRVDNAPQGGTQAFKTYTNALFLNDTIVVPKYGDAARDDAAKAAYTQALGSKYTIVQVDASEAIALCGAARCAAREIPRLPSKKDGKEGGSKSPTVSFDPATGLLSISDDVVNFLGSPGDAVTAPEFAMDPLLGSTIEISDLSLHAGMSVPDAFAFVGGTIRFHKDGADLFSAKVPVFTIYGTQPPGALDMFGVLHDVMLAPPGTSPWLDAFRAEVLARPPLLPDLFMSSAIDLIALSQGFTQGFAGVQLTSVGVTGNGSVPEPPLVLLMMTTLCGLGVLRAKYR